MTKIILAFASAVDLAFDLAGRVRVFIRGLARSGPYRSNGYIPQRREKLVGSQAAKSTPQSYKTYRRV
ncbi:hypothetical protein [Pseudomonas sp. Au-Pse12]|uniref:hypothetical protein n=1 Tax=Pseudomonas sp. Au-Pse12 TaxID=2906459 RepID=UPI001E48A368|nr:hypothetical protein [Pseudomonas sp. Au-Pse12]MCE4053052.1 hypothetical protein [Pseudomonas sp. Au-Pse12]